MNDYIYISPLVRYGGEVLPCLVVDVVAPFREPALELARDAAAAPALPLRSLGLGRRQLDGNLPATTWVTWGGCFGLVFTRPGGTPVRRQRAVNLTAT